MRYAKLINDYPSYAPRRMRIGNVWVYNPTDEQLLSEGYFPVIETEPPDVDELHYAEPRYVERDGSIMQEWEIVEIEQPPMTDEDALVRYANELTGANDQTLIEAAETLITERIKEDSK